MSALIPGAGKAAPRSTRVSWFELFYDLVVVASVSYGSKLYTERPSWTMGSWLFLSLIVLMTFWLLTMLSHNLFPREDHVRRLLVVVQMMGLIVGSLSLGRSENGIPDAIGLAALAVSFASVALVYVRCRRRDSREKAAARILAGSTTVAALVMAVGFLVARFGGAAVEPFLVWFLFFGLACGIVPLLFIVLNGRTSAASIDAEHLGERMGQLVLIVLGESFVSLIFDLSGLSSIPNPLYFVTNFAVVFSIWTIYFTSVLPCGVPGDARRLRVWILLHCLLMFGAIAAAGSLAALTVLPFDTVPTNQDYWTPLPLFYVMVSILGLSLLAGRHRIAWPLHAGVTGVLAVLSVLALWVAPSQARYLTLIAAALVVLDAVVTASAMQRSGSEPRSSR